MVAALEHRRMSHLRDPFIDALADLKVMDNFRSNYEINKNMTEDPDFCKTLEKLHTEAKRLLKEFKKPDDIDWIAMGQRTATEAYADPRIMQAVMALYGRPLKVGEDIDSRPREPLDAAHLDAVSDVEDAAAAKAIGNDFFKKSDYQMALAHYQRALTVLRMSQKYPSVDTTAMLLSNASLCFIKLKFGDRAKACTSQALRELEKAGDKTVDRSKLYYRRALACEQLEEYSMAVDDLKRALKEVQQSGSGSSEEKRLTNEIIRMQRLDRAQVAALKKMDEERPYWAGFVKKDVVAEYEEANKWTSNPSAVERRFDDEGKEIRFDKWSERHQDGTPSA